jgi:hypothetical protein
MRKEPKNMAEHRSDAFASVARAFGEANARYQALAVESLGRAAEIQSQFLGRTYATNMAEMSKIGRMFVASYSTFVPHLRALTPDLNKRKAADSQQARSVEARSAIEPRRRTAAQDIGTKRKTGTVAKSQLSKRLAKTKRRGRG